jgi:hypothetical protein
MGATAFCLGMCCPRGRPKNQAMVAENIRPLVVRAAMIGSTKAAMLRIVCSSMCCATAHSVRICNISIMVEITSAKGEMFLAYFAT